MIGITDAPIVVLVGALDELNALLGSAWGSFRTAHMTATIGMGRHVIDEHAVGWVDGATVEAWVEPNWEDGWRTRFHAVRRVEETTVNEIVNDGRNWWWLRDRELMEGHFPPVGSPAEGVMDTMLFHDLAHEHGGVESELTVSDIVIAGDRASFTVRRGDDDHPPALDFGLCPGDWWCDSYRVTTGSRGTLARVEARYRDGTIAMTCDATTEFDIDIPDTTFARPA
jgi:hypothetical protein